ncbi:MULTISPECIES: hypothetical protein [unclassified Halomonas]|uniref:hypothetical protein n=1 Tax=unclassified Halomonas TaxID=2609666 RepID=UPI002076B345|nr:MULTISPECIES: hypothetical protein [unclassified Halomonas]
MTLSLQQRTSLKRQGITVLIERGDGLCTCMTRSGRRKYCIEDLVELAKPGFCDRFTAWIGRRVSA